MEDKNTTVTKTEEYVPRNAIVAAKENLYDRANITVAQLDVFIFMCIAAVAVLVIGGVLL